MRARRGQSCSTRIGAVPVDSPLTCLREFNERESYIHSTASRRVVRAPHTHVGVKNLIPSLYPSQNQERKSSEQKSIIIIIMPRFNSLLAVFGLLATACTFDNALASTTGSLRKPGWQPSFTDELAARLDAVEDEIKMIPALKSKIEALELEVSKLEKHRILVQDECGFSLSEKGVCQLDVPLELISDFIVRGNTTLADNLRVRGDTFMGGNHHHWLRQSIYCWLHKAERLDCWE